MYKKSFQPRAWETTYAHPFVQYRLTFCFVWDCPYAKAYYISKYDDSWAVSATHAPTPNFGYNVMEMLRNEKIYGSWFGGFSH